MRIIRLGSISVNPIGLLDFINNDEVDELFIVTTKQEDKLRIINAAKYFDVERLLAKIRFIELEYNNILDLLRSKVLLEIIQQDMVIWVGDNDFDESNFIIPWLRSNGIANFIIRSYKETRYCYKEEELLTLRLSNAIIVPSPSYIDFFTQLYGKDSIDPNKFYFADLDWRYSKLITFVQGLKGIKLSFADKKPHVCILTGRAIWDPSEKRSAARYFYLPLIKELIEKEIHVHLHALKIIKNLEEQSGDINPYQDLANNSPFFHIEKPLALKEDFTDYIVLKRYDAGILHNYNDNDPESFTLFQKINIPNRIYDYQTAKVIPIVRAGVLPETERIIKKTKFGIIYREIDELTDQLHQMVNGNNYLESIDNDYFYSANDFTKVFFEAIKTRNGRINIEKIDINITNYPILYIKYNINTYCKNINEDLLTYLANGNSKVIIFGAGNAGVKTIQFIQEMISQLKNNIKIMRIFDNDSKKWGTKIMSYEVKNPTLDDCKFADKIIIASQWAKEIKVQLKMMGVSEEKIISAF